MNDLVRRLRQAVGRTAGYPKSQHRIGESPIWTALEAANEIKRLCLAHEVETPDGWISEKELADLRSDICGAAIIVDSDPVRDDDSPRRPVWIGPPVEGTRG